MSSPRFLRRALTFALPLLLLFSRPAAAGLMADSTMSDRWKLANGLEVRVRHVPGASGVAIVVAYRAGTSYEPAGREGLAQLLAELQYHSAAGDIPERTREEMGSLRPLGWGVQVNERHATLTEIAAPDRYAGVLHQVATRMKGVQPTAADLKQAADDVRGDLALRHFGRADLGLYYRVRELARGANDEQLLRLSSAAGLKAVTLAEATAALQKLYAPANASLAIAGDLGEVDVRALVEREFGSIPGGTAQPEAAAAMLQPVSRATPFSGLDHTIGCVGVFAPAIEDSLHPAFFLSMVITGPWFTNALGRPNPPLSSRFSYSIYDEADLVRFYPEPRPGETAPGALGSQLAAQLDKLAETTMERDLFETVRRSVAWLLGGDLTKAVKDQMRKQPGALGTLANGMAARALWKGDAFWDEYLLRFQTTNRGHSTFYSWLTDPQHQAALLFTPKP
ncbi:MAG: insulinase family protein [Candidatus Eisenbacteria bacterium]|uniref:Insulinase family protein n=1 Tax=Eiseniibacteriota bacterium TaxID=2212470 RepID=A0A933SBA6_UNCEI|nr:insulinase family protein [Candidatus Eisenbacteria bacterium]